MVKSLTSLTKTIFIWHSHKYCQKDCNCIVLPSTLCSYFRLDYAVFFITRLYSSIMIRFTKKLLKLNWKSIFLIAWKFYRTYMAASLIEFVNVQNKDFQRSYDHISIFPQFMSTAGKSPEQSCYFSQTWPKYWLHILTLSRVQIS